MVFTKVITQEVNVVVPKIGKRTKGTSTDDLGTILIGQQCVLKHHPYLYPERCGFRYNWNAGDSPCSRCLLSNDNFPDYLDSLQEVA